MDCRFCSKELVHEFVDLGTLPISNTYLTLQQLNEPEVFYPLKVYVCDNCFLVQIGEIIKAENIFNSNYPYFSSYSKSWLNHCKQYTNYIIKRLKLTPDSLVVELASNDGYLLQYFKEKCIPTLGIEPAKNVADVAQKMGIDTIKEFFSVSLAKKLLQKGKKADLIIGNNVLAHVPKINDFVAGMKIMLAEGGVITMEFPHLINLIDKNQFDTIYQEHYSYLSFSVVQRIFNKQGLELFDVEEIPTHGGSIRIFAKHKEDKTKNISNSVYTLLKREMEKGVNSLTYYTSFQSRVLTRKRKFLKFLLEQKKDGKIIVGYGAATKGNTLLNFYGVKRDLIDFVVDASTYKQGKFLPASHIPIVNVNQIKANKPDLIIILPWNLKDEIMDQLSYVKEWGAKFVIPTTTLEVI